jgi:5-methylcytosine-specific restriction endonuclease McrA
MRLKQGFVREDGKVFSQYYKVNGVEKEMWYSLETFNKIIKRRIDRTIARQRKNKEKHSAYVKEWRSRNPEKSKKHSRESSQAWRKRNPKASKIRSTLMYGKRKAIKSNNLHPDHDKSKELILVKCAKLMNLEVDHIIPLTRGGMHWHENLRLLPKSLNASKNNRLDSELSLQMQLELSVWKNFSKDVISDFYIDDSE